MAEQWADRRRAEAAGRLQALQARVNQLLREEAAEVAAEMPRLPMTDRRPPTPRRSPRPWHSARGPSGPQPPAIDFDGQRTTNGWGESLLVVADTGEEAEEARLAALDRRRQIMKADAKRRRAEASKFQRRRAARELKAEAQRHGATVLQASWRGTTCRKKRRAAARRQSAAEAIQSRERGNRARAEAVWRATVRRAGVVLAIVVRNLQPMAELAARRAAAREAANKARRPAMAVRIQARHRGRIDRRQVAWLRHEAFVAARRTEALARRRQAEEDQRAREAGWRCVPSPGLWLARAPPQPFGHQHALTAALTAALARRVCIAFCIVMYCSRPGWRSPFQCQHADPTRAQGGRADRGRGGGGGAAVGSERIRPVVAGRRRHGAGGGGDCDRTAGGGGGDAAAAACQGGGGCSEPED